MVLAIRKACNSFVWVILCIAAQNVDENWKMSVPVHSGIWRNCATHVWRIGILGKSNGAKNLVQMRAKFEMAHYGAITAQCEKWRKDGANIWRNDAVWHRHL